MCVCELVCVCKGRGRGCVCESMCTCVCVHIWICMGDCMFNAIFKCKVDVANCRNVNNIIMIYYEFINYS